MGLAGNFMELPHNWDHWMCDVRGMGFSRVWKDWTCSLQDIERWEPPFCPNNPCRSWDWLWPRSSCAAFEIFTGSEKLLWTSMDSRGPRPQKSVMSWVSLLCGIEFWETGTLQTATLNANGCWVKHRPFSFTFAEPWLSRHMRSLSRGTNYCRRYVSQRTRRPGVV